MCEGITKSAVAGKQASGDGGRDESEQRIYNMVGFIKRMHV